MTTEKTTAAKLAARYRRDGYAIVRALFTPGEVAEIRDTFMRQAEAGPQEGLSDILSGPALTPRDPLAFYPRMMHPHRHPDKPIGNLAMRRMLDPRLKPLLSRFMNDDEPLAAQSMFYFKPPGARGQDLHQDNFYLRVKPGNCHAMWLAVDDADSENGGMIVVPGSNHHDVICPEQSDLSKSFTNHHVPVPKDLSEQPLELKAGDVLFFDGSVIHGSYPNTSPDRFRRAFICHYLPRASVEMAQYYDAFTFDGEKIGVPPAIGGGPCGVAEPMGPH